MAKGDSKAKVEHPAMVVEMIPIAGIEIGVQMIRSDQNDDEIAELAADIAARGLMQPIGVAPLTGGKFQLLWGSRRLAAHQRLRRVEIAARICSGSMADEIVSTAARENLLRRDLTLEEEINAIRGFTAEGKSASQISDLVGKSRAWVDRRLAFDSLPPAIRDYVLSGDLPIGHGEALALIADPGAQSYLITHCLQHRPSLVSLRALIESIEATPSFGAAVEAGAEAAQSTGSAQSIYVGCSVCLTPTLVAELAVIRCCGGCHRTITQLEVTTDAGAGPETRQ